MIPVDPVVIAAVWLWGLRDVMLRSGRTVAVLIAFTVVYVITAVALAPPLGLAARLAVAAGALALLKTWSHALVALPTEQRMFDRELSRGLDEIHHHARATLSGSISAESEISRLGSAADALAMLRPPNGDWARSRDDIVEFVQEQSRLIGMLARGGSVPDDVIAQRRHQAHKLTSAYHQVRRRSRRFWS